ncbi:MAG: hypothetical protein AAB420_00975 [Patescibacteria group bacterium]
MDSYTTPTTKPLYRGTQIVWGIIRLFVMSKSVSTPEVAEKLEQKEK